MSIKKRTFGAWFMVMFMVMFLLVLTGGTATAAGRLVSISVTPSNSSILLGTTLQFTATGTYSDGSTRDITKAVRWSSSATAVATIGNNEGMSTKGLATSVAIGATTITATQGNISGTTILTVKTLVSITVAPSSPSIVLGISQQFTATGTYSDNSAQDMTTSVTWSSSNTGIADISNTPGSNGLATSLSVGTATVTATSGSISGSTDLTITPAVLVSITIPTTTSSVMVGDTRQFTAIGIYSDNSMQDLTTLVDWASSNPEVATISNVSGLNGLSTAVGLGSTNITAILESISGSTTLTVAGVVNIPITGQTTSYAAGDDGNIQEGVSWPNPRFSTNADTTITDNFTGLVWTSDGNAPGLVACNPGVTKTWQGALDYVSCLNANSYLGHNDWRLPNKRELRSLIDYSQADTSTVLNTQGFSNVQNIYWSSTTLASYPSTAWFVPMHGGMDCYHKSVSLHVWPVRSGQAVYTASGALPATGQMTCYDAAGNVIDCAGMGQDGELRKGITWPIPRFTTNADTTATDNLTGLVWTSNGNAPGPAECPTTSYPYYYMPTWQGALDYVSCLNANNYLGYNDWRLPNINELESLIDDELSRPVISMDSGYYWSSTTIAGGTSSAWVISILSGRLHGPDKSTTWFVRPVRAGR